MEKTRAVGRVLRSPQGYRSHCRCAQSASNRQAPRLQEPRYATGFSNGNRDRSNGFNGSYRFLAATTLLRAPGCYAYQIGSDVQRGHVMRVVLTDGAATQGRSRR
jgi:hypothetical protein